MLHPSVEAESSEKIEAMLVTQLEIEENERWKRLHSGRLREEAECRLVVCFRMQRHLDAGLVDRRAEQIAFTGAVVDQENG